MYVGERDILEIFLHRKIKIKICLGKENHNDVISSTGRSIVTLREFRFFFFFFLKMEEDKILVQERNKNKKIKEFICCQKT